MTTDVTEGPRGAMVAEINHDPGSREALEEKHEQVWDMQELQEEFKVLGFMAPFVSVERKSDGCRGFVTFQHMPRFYFDFKESD